MEETDEHEEDSGEDDDEHRQEAELEDEGKSRGIEREKSASVSALLLPVWILRLAFRL